MIVLESNQNHATAKDTEVCNALPASMGMGGGYIPMVISYGFDRYNQAVEKDVAQPLRSHDGGDTTPKVYTTHGRGDDGLLVMSRRFSDIRVYESDVSPTIETGSGDGGNNLPMVLDTLVFDEANITCPTNGNRPKWGDACHSLTKEAGRAIVVIKSSGFKPRNSKDARSIGYEEEKSPTLAADSGGCEVGILVKCGEEAAEKSQGLSTHITSRDVGKERG